MKSKNSELKEYLRILKRHLQTKREVAFSRRVGSPPPKQQTSAELLGRIQVYDDVIALIEARLEGP